MSQNAGKTILLYSLNSRVDVANYWWRRQKRTTTTSSCVWLNLASFRKRWCREDINASVLHVPTACVTSDAVVLSSERTSLSCWTCTEV